MGLVRLTIKYYFHFLLSTVLSLIPGKKKKSEEKGFNHKNMSHQVLRVLSLSKKIISMTVWLLVKYTEPFPTLHQNKSWPCGRMTCPHREEIGGYPSTLQWWGARAAREVVPSSSALDTALHQTYTTTGEAKQLKPEMASLRNKNNINWWINIL